MLKEHCQVIYSESLTFQILKKEKLLTSQVFFPVETTVVDVKLTPYDSHFQKYNFKLLKTFSVSP